MKRVIAAILTVLLLCTVLLTGCFGKRNNTEHSKELSPSSPEGSKSEESAPQEQEEPFELTKKNFIKSMYEGYERTKKADKLVANIREYAVIKLGGDAQRQEKESTLHAAYTEEGVFTAHALSKGSESYYLGNELWSKFDKDVEGQGVPAHINYQINDETANMETVVLRNFLESFFVNFEGTLELFAQSEYTIDRDDEGYEAKCVMDGLSFLQMVAGKEADGEQKKAFLEQLNQYSSFSGTIRFFLTREGYFSGMAIGTEYRVKHSTYNNDYIVTDTTTLRLNFKEDVQVAAPAWYKERIYNSSSRIGQIKDGVMYEYSYAKGACTLSKIYSTTDGEVSVPCLILPKRLDGVKVGAFSPAALLGVRVDKVVIPAGVQVVEQVPLDAEMYFEDSEEAVEKPENAKECYFKGQWAYDEEGIPCPLVEK